MNQEISEFLITGGGTLEMPNVQEDIYRPVRHWRKYAQMEKHRSVERAQFLTEYFSGHSLGLDLIWDGDGKISNAALTIFRRLDSATVVKGLLGKPPHTALVIDYTLFERLRCLWKCRASTAIATLTRW